MNKKNLKIFKLNFSNINELKKINETEFMLDRINSIFILNIMALLSILISTNTKGYIFLLITLLLYICIYKVIKSKKKNLIYWYFIINIPMLLFEFILVINSFVINNLENVLIFFSILYLINMIIAITVMKKHEFISEVKVQLCQKFIHFLRR